MRDAQNDTLSLRLKQLEIDKELAKANEGKQTDAEKAAVRAEAVDKIKLARSLIQRSRDGWFTTGFGAGMAGSFNGSAAFDVAKDTETLKNAGALTRIMEMAATNGGKNPLTPLSNSDFQALASSLSNLDTGQSDGQYQANVQRVIDLYTRAYQAAGGSDIEGDIDPSKRRRTDGGLPISTLGPSDGRPTIDPTGNREFSTEADRALSAEAQAAFNAGATREQIDAIAAKYGAKPFGPDLDQAIKGRDAGAKTQFTTPTTGRETSGLARQVMGAAANSPVGSYAINSANAMTLGTLDELSGLLGADPNQTQAAKELAAENNPMSSALGSITGGTLALAAPEAAMSRFGIGGGAGIIAPRLAATDAAYGAAYGAGENNNDRLSGALSGGTMAALGGVGGRGLMTGGGMAFRGVRDAGVRRLADAGVPMTLGQLVSQGGRVGRAVKGVEDRLAGMPLVGDLINGRRLEGLREFNRAAYDEALAPIGAGSAGQVAEAGINRAQQAVSQAYDDALNGVNISPDAPFIGGMRRVRGDAMAIPNHGATLGHTLDNDLGNLFGNNGMLSGENLQAGLQTLRQEAAAYKGQPLGSSAMRSLRDAEGEITDLVGRQAPDVMPALNNANQAYRNLRILEDAVGEAGRNTDGIFTPAQLTSMSARNTKAYGGKAANARGDRPFFELSRDGQEILPSKVPDSGSAGRLALPAILGGAGAGAGYLGGDTEKGAALGLALALPATRLGQRTIQSALIDRPDAFVRIGDQFYRKRAIGGMFGAAALPYLSQGN
ncbi:hypothetical protein [Sphingobium sp. YR768]|uniref:hypothetical protein n=1 Tax=Sphingobium sp. YR768 TaxID=1884365 RepID=UPI00115FF05A|nr:hypothetical protein [Sphingobium sp. YR768]